VGSQRSQLIEEEAGINIIRTKIASSDVKFPKPSRKIIIFLGWLEGTG
jgi:hypothetical protein